MYYSTQQYPISYGDRVFIRVTQNYSDVLETAFDNVNGFTQIFAEIRYLLRHLQGMVKVTVRNYHRGWSTDRMLKLYGKFPRPSMHSRPDLYTEETPTLTSQPAMLMPWQH